MAGRTAWVFLVLLSGGCPEFPEHLLHQDRRVERDAAADAPRDRTADARADGAGEAASDRGKHDTTPDGLVPGTYVAVAAGTFQMGAPTTEPCSSSNESLHTVTLSRTFLMGSTEVTQADFLKAMGYNPSKFTACGASCPVENVSWHEAAAYCNALSAKVALPQCYTCTGAGAAVTCAAAPGSEQAAVYACRGYRLPTEAEWEYAYRAGTVTALYSGAITASCNDNDPNADLIAYYNDKAPHPVGQKLPNAWKLHDMAGNVWEWTNDLHVNDLGAATAQDPWGGTTGAARTYRGGSWFYGIKHLRGAYRAGFSSTGRANDMGFRCVRAN